MVRRKRQHALQEEFGIIENIELHANLGEKPHALDMIRPCEQELPNQPLGRKGIALSQHALGSHDLRWQLRQGCDLLGCGLGIRPLSQGPMENLQRSPTRRQRGVELYGTLVGRNGG